MSIFQTFLNALVAYSRKEGLFLDPSFALFEQRLRHGNPKAALQQYVKSLADNFSWRIPPANVATMEAYFAAAAEPLRPNVDLFRDYPPIIKLIWNSAGKFAAKIDRLAGAIQTKDLPRFLFAYLFATVAYYVKDHPEKFSQAIYSKVQSDMAFSSSPANEGDRLWNVAFDISLFAFCIDAAVRKGTAGTLYLSKIASADASFEVFCRNIKASAIQIRASDEVPNAFWGLVPDADVDVRAAKYAMEKFPKSLPPAPLTIIERLGRLKKTATDIVSGAETDI